MVPKEVGRQHIADMAPLLPQRFQNLDVLFVAFEIAMECLICSRATKRSYWLGFDGSDGPLGLGPFCGDDHLLDAVHIRTD